MADESDNIRLGVAFDGGAGVNQFIQALRPLPGQVDAVLQEASKQGGSAAGWQQKGRQAAQAVLAAYQAHMAGFKDFDMPGAGAKMAANMGMKPEQIRSQRQFVAEMEQAYERLKRLGGAEGGNGAPTKSFTQATLLGLNEAKASTDKVTAAQRELKKAADDAAAALARTQAVTAAKGFTGPYVKESKTGANVAWSSRAKEIAAASGLVLPEKPPTPAPGQNSQQAGGAFLREAYTRQLDEQRRIADATKAQADMFQRAPVFSPEPERAARAIRTPTELPAQLTAQQRQLLRGLEDTGTNAGAAARAGVGTRDARKGLQQIEAEYPQLVAAIRAEREARAAAARRLRAETDALRTGGNAAPPPVSAQAVRAQQAIVDAKDARLAEVAKQRRERLAAEEAGTARPRTPEQQWANSVAEQRNRAAEQQRIRDLASQSPLTEQQSQEAEQAQRAERRRRRAIEDRRAMVEESRRAREESARPQPRPVGRDGQAAERGPRAPLTAAQIEANRAASRAALGGGVRQQFMSGFRGNPDRPAAEMAGQTARTALAYGAAYRAIAFLNDAIARTVTETLEYEGALTDLSVATMRSRAENAALATSLTNIAAAAGFSGAQGVQAGAKAVGIYGVAQESQQEQERVARISSEVALRVARVSGSKDPIAVQTQLAGAARSFGFGVDRLSEIEDMITYVSRNTGQAPTELLGATSNIATLGRSSGFSPEQLMAIVAQVGTTTGQNPESTAGQFRQVLSREFESVAKSASSVFGIDTSGLKTTAEVIDAVSQIEGRTQAQTNDFTATFGKGGSQTVAMITLENWDRIQGLASGATGSPGIGAETFDIAMNDIGQKLRVLGSEALNLGAKLVQTGVVDFIGALVIGATSLVQAISGVLDTFNQIPRPLRSAALALVEIAAAAALLTSLGVVGRGTVAGRLGGAVLGGLGLGGPASARHSADTGVAPPVGSAASRARASLNAPFAMSWAESQRRVASTRGGVLGAADRMSGRTGITGASALVGLGVAAVGLQQFTKAIAVTSEAAELLAQAQRQAATAITETQYLDAAAAAATARQQIEANTLGGMKVGDVGNLLPSIWGSINNGDEIEQLRKLETDSLARAADVKARQETGLEEGIASEVFTDMSAQGLADSMALLEERGYGAAERMDLLSAALFQFSNIASQKGMEGVEAAIGRSQFDAAAGKVREGVGNAFTNTADWQRAQAVAGVEFSKLGGPINSFIASTFFDPDRRKEDSNADLLSGDLAARAQQAAGDSVLAQLEGMQIDDMALLEQADVDAIVAQVQADAKGAFSDDEWKSLGADVQKALLDQVINGTRSALNAYGAGTVTTANVDDVLRGLPSYAQAMGQEAASATGSSLAGAEAEVAALQTSLTQIKGLRKVSLFSSTTERLIKDAEEALVVASRGRMEALISDIQRLTGARTSFLSDDDVAGRLAVEAQGLAQQKSAAAKQFATTLFSGGGIDQAAIAATVQAQGGLAANARAAIRDGAATQAARITAGANPASAIGTARAAVDAAELGLVGLKEGTEAWNSAQGAINQARFAYSQSILQGQNSNALASVDPRNTTGRIAQEIANAQRELRVYPGGDPQAGALRDQLAQLNVQMQEAMVSQANAAASAGIAGKQSGLEQARVAIGNAQRSLNIQLPGTEAYYGALAQLRESQAQLAEQERTQADRVRRLGSDLTDPLAQARLDTQAALETYWANAQSGEGEDILAQNQLDIRSAQNQEEAAAFSQRLSDVQVAEDLGRISHGQYMSYLQSEHDRLSAVGDRTRQQQDQLNEIDQLMKSAAEEMQGQWNLGDIELPTAYEMRRAMGSGAPTQVADYSNSNNVVNINGADLAAVIDYITTYMGAGAQVLRAAPERI